MRVFADAIEIATQFTRPVHSIARFYGSTEVFPGAATLFFVNADGWALTCRHVAQQLILSDQLLDNYERYKAERAGVPSKNRQQVKAVEKKYGIAKGVLVELQNRVINCVDGPLELEMRVHPELDIALLKFSNFTALSPTSFPVFPADGSELKQGRFLCRLGFPFPEFANFDYNAAAESIEWTAQGRDVSPQFPLEGMVTRHLLGPTGGIVGFEMSTPGLRGQSGGPAFDAQGRVWGMQAATNHLDLNFDVEMQVVRDGRRKRVSDHAFLHVGHCVHVDALKDFLRQHNVAFAESA